MLKAIRAWFQLPGPKDLGKADSNNALPWNIHDEPGVYDWPAYYRDIKRMFPFRYWLLHRVPRYLNRKRNSVEEAIYWVKCHTLPSYRWHLLDLRDPGPDIYYRYGFRDADTRMLWACFAILRDFVEKEKPSDPATWDRSAWETGDDTFKVQKANHDEVLALYHWWTVGRLEEQEEQQRLWRERTGKEDTRWLEHRKMLEEREQEMLLRLVKVRHSMWT